MNLLNWKLVGARIATKHSQRRILCRNEVLLYRIHFLNHFITEFLLIFNSIDTVSFSLLPAVLPSSSPVQPLLADLGKNVEESAGKGSRSEPLPPWGFKDQLDVKEQSSEGRGASHKGWTTRMFSGTIESCPTCLS